MIFYFCVKNCKLIIFLVGLFSLLMILVLFVVLMLLLLFVRRIDDQIQLIELISKKNSFFLFSLNTILSSC